VNSRGLSEWKTLRRASGPRSKMKVSVIPSTPSLAHVIHLPLVRTLVQRPAMALLQKVHLLRRKTVASESTLSCHHNGNPTGALPPLAGVGEMLRIRQPNARAMEPGHCQRVRTDFARQISASSSPVLRSYMAIVPDIAAGSQVITARTSFALRT
jgi:hypothetical protein